MLLIAAAIYMSGNYVAPVAQTTCGAGTTSVSNNDGTNTCVSDTADSPTVVITQQQPTPVAYFEGRYFNVR